MNPSSAYDPQSEFAEREIENRPIQLAWMARKTAG
jgi:hypothetical protein